MHNSRNPLSRLRSTALPLPAPLALAVLLALPMAARAGTVMTGEHKDLDGKKETFTYTVSLDKDRVRMETSQDAGHLFIYRGDKQAFWIVDSKEKSYMEMTLKDMEAMAEKMEAARKQMEAQMAKMPPEQREMMEKMMKGKLPGADGSKVVYKKIGSGKSGSWSCDNYETSRDGVKRSEMCYTEAKNLGLSAEDLESMKSMAKPFEKIAKDFQAFLPGTKADGAPDGIPVKTVAFMDGKASSETVVKSVKKESLAASAFDLPAGLTKKEFPGHQKPK